MMRPETTDQYDYLSNEICRQYILEVADEDIRYFGTKGNTRLALGLVVGVGSPILEMLTQHTINAASECASGAFVMGCLALANQEYSKARPLLHLMDVYSVIPKLDRLQHRVHQFESFAYPEANMLSHQIRLIQKRYAETLPKAYQIAMLPAGARRNQWNTIAQPIENTYKNAQTIEEHTQYVTFTYKDVRSMQERNTFLIDMADQVRTSFLNYYAKKGDQPPASTQPDLAKLTNISQARVDFNRITIFDIRDIAHRLPG